VKPLEQEKNNRFYMFNSNFLSKMTKSRFNLRKMVAGVASLAVVVMFVACSSTPTMKGTTYVNNNAKNKPMVFMTETVGVLEFVDDKKVDILFPYAIDTESLGGSSGIRISSELWISGEYERIGNTITIHFKLSESQEEPGELKVEVKDEGKTLLGKEGQSFNKIDKQKDK